MARRYLIAGAIGFAGLLTMVLWSARPSSAVTPQLRREAIVPGVSSDGGWGGTTTPPPSGNLRQVTVEVELNVEEGSFTEGAVTPIQVRGVALATLPAAGAPAVVVPGTWSIEAHPADKCSWGLISIGDRKVRIWQVSNSPMKVGVDFVGPEWHYSVECPGKTLRFPAFAERSVAGWLGLIMTDIGGPGGAVVTLPLAAGNENCLVNEDTFPGGSPFGTARIHIRVESDLSPQGCLQHPPH